MRTLIAIGHKQAEYHSQEWMYSSQDPNWHPQPDPSYTEEDEDNYKRDVEDKLAWG